MTSHIWHDKYEEGCKYCKEEELELPFWEVTNHSGLRQQLGLKKYEEQTVE